jgi:hypothetical protein
MRRNSAGFVDEIKRWQSRFNVPGEVAARVAFDSR